MIIYIEYEGVYYSSAATLLTEKQHKSSTCVCCVKLGYVCPADMSSVERQLSFIT